LRVLGVGCTDRAILFAIGRLIRELRLDYHISCVVRHPRGMRGNPLCDGAAGTAPHFVRHRLSMHV
jgi:hypothetical protein